VVEHLTLNPNIKGSTPATGTRKVAKSIPKSHLNLFIFHMNRHTKLKNDYEYFSSSFKMCSSCSKVVNAQLRILKLAV
jgi:hypothetical protein